MLADAGIVHERTEVDFTANPPWLAELTPIGKIPIMVVGEQVIFESSVILEYLNESCSNRYLPSDIRERAAARSWCTVIDAIHRDVSVYFSAKTESEFDAAWKRIDGRLTRLVEFGESLGYFGDQLMLPGIYLAPLFVLLQTLFEYTGDCFPPASPVAKLSRRLLDMPSVKPINDAHYRRRLLRFLLSADSHFAHLAAQSHSELLDNDAQELRAAGYLTPRIRP